ncbi:MAG TPA: glucose-1-phosphate cytidylyltransferase [Baekduia sp.]|uniref:glucose-1-phosphate cytidylyltransferase n=1 Tax=Baekduia sp. TaxID=2600305 RepID=UPI002BA3C48B|nr:glucose-1-phosphate cytidylyltransferase [Baekduia sp.]HMJ33094.1 glucose-1-phosphate cytidylyltransferase [Baekduia sp.]
MSLPPPWDAPKVVLLCGGMGSRMREETEYRPKPMVEVGGRPLLWHIMKLYAAHGLTDFVCCLGYRGAMIKQYFLDYHALRSDMTVSLASGDVEYASGEVDDWRVSLVDTGQDAMTGARVKRVEHHLGGADVFLCTYGDGLADVDIRALVDFHRSHGRLATVTGVYPPSRFGELATDGSQVTSFVEKPAGEARISGGFFVFDRAVLDRLSPASGCVLEREPLEGLAADGELCVFPHDGFWQCADTVRDVEHLRGLWDRGDAPWRVWDDRTESAAAPHPGRRQSDRVDALLRAAGTR